MSFLGSAYVLVFLIAFAKLSVESSAKSLLSPLQTQPSSLGFLASPESSVLPMSTTILFPSWPVARPAQVAFNSLVLSICSIAPRVCPNAEIKFYLYTSANPNVATELSDTYLDSIKNAPFNTGPIKVLIHGFTSSHIDMMYLKDAYFQNGRVINVILVDYSHLCRFPCYVEAVRNSVVVGNCTALFFSRLLEIRTDIQVSQIHIIGGSLGAQVGAQTCRFWKQGHVERLTGIEAAFPLFPSVYSDYITIRKGLAKFVDGLHTASGTFGQPLPYGDIDFYANGGFVQPACTFGDFVCDHTISGSYYNESINSPTAFKAYPCLPFLDAQPCQLIKIGPSVYFADQLDPRSRGIYGFNTNAKPPYGIPDL